MNSRHVSASRFKSECLSILDEIAASGETLVVTKRGRPVAQVGPVDAPRPLAGSVTFLVDDDDLTAPVDGEWEAAGR